MYKSVKAIALGTVATSLGIMHFDPERADEDGRYQGRILPSKDAAKAEQRGLVEITGDATEADFKAQQAGFPNTGRVREFGQDAIAEASQAADTDPASLAGDSAVATANVRNYAAGDEPTGLSSGDDPDAAPLPGTEGSNPGASDLNQNVTGVKKVIDAATDVEKLDALRDAETKGQNRTTVLEAIDARKAELAKA